MSNTSARTIDAYLTTHDLDRSVDLVIGRTDADTATLTLNAHLITQAVTRLEAEATACAIMTTSPAAIDAGRLAGVATIGYANEPGRHERLTAAGADAVVASLSNVTLRVRARPLPS